MASEQPAPVRYAEFAGTFYPAEPDDLRRSVKELLDNPTNHSTAKPRILIVPHAGYTYSGRVAGAGFARVRGCTDVILLGVSHRQRFDHAAAYGGKGWQSPFGQVMVNQDMVGFLTGTCPAFRIDNDVHANEHALEVQLPFLQETLAEFRIVPLLLGSHHAAAEISDALARILNSQTLLVVSSDLSHFPNQDDAARVDSRTIEAILSADPARFRSVITRQMRQGIPGLATCACGAAAIETALRAAQALSLQKTSLIAYQNSGQVMGESARVVGYASITFH